MTNLANYYGNPYYNSGGSSGGYTYDLGPANWSSPMANFATTPYTSPVGSYPPNGYGLYDIVGNLYHYCWDWAGTALAGGTDPRGPATGTAKSVRGASWGDAAPSLRVAGRYSGYGPSTAGNIYYSFRTVRSIP
jgi:formylglycine-generating enzyme required for sulfatase activity